MRYWQIGICSIAAICFGLPAQATDQMTLVRILTRADIAHNFTIYCAQYDPSIVERTKGGNGDIQSLMLHVRDEVVAGLPQAEAKEIVVRSANAARAGALMAIREHYGSDSAQERSRLSNWCKATVLPSVIEFVKRHDDKHQLFVEAIRNAKQTPKAIPNGSSNYPDPLDSSR
jgi:hypothetical protein